MNNAMIHDDEELFILSITQASLFVSGIISMKDFAVNKQTDDTLIECLDTWGYTPYNQLLMAAKLRGQDNNQPFVFTILMVTCAQHKTSCHSLLHTLG